MELKRIINLILTLILVYCFCFTIPATAKQLDVISLGRISVTMPKVSVEIKGSGYDKNSISSTLGSEKLSVEDVFDYKVEKNSSLAYVLVDLSTSMYDSFDLVKSNIVSYIESLSDNDKVVLITFGETEVNTVLDGSEMRKEAVDTVKGLKCDENGTLFYEALNQVYQLSNSSNSNFDREYVIAFSDGIDVQKGSSTFNEVMKLYDSRALPLYAACSNGTSKNASDKFGELSRVSGGSFSVIKSKDDFNEFLNQINDVTIVKLKASSNYADGKEKQLSVKVGSSQVECNIPIIRSISDTSAPQVSKLAYDVKKDAFVISFTERVVGADSNAAYKITNSKGEKLEISEVFYSEKDNIYEIKTKTPITKETYTFKFFGIKDNSKEANLLTGTQVVEVKKSSNSVGLPIWSIILIVVGGVTIVIVTALIWFVSEKKKSSDDAIPDDLVVPENNSVADIHCVTPKQDVVKHHIKTTDAIRIRLRIYTGKTSEQNIETSILSSLIVGRSDICDIYIDDTKLSRQHFVIENDNGTFYVMDLQSRNGTMLNGIRINSRHRISSGDKIAAGLSDIIITILGR